jgi:uncharacterized phiE125 gp8 family phage protein
MLKTNLVTDSTVEPVSVSEVKNHLRVTDNSEDALIAGLITSARKIVEQFTRRTLINQTWRLYLDQFPYRSTIELPFPPLATVTHIKYYDQDGALQTLPTSEYQTDNRSTPGLIVLTENGAWPLTEGDKVNAVEIEFIAGYGATAAAVPSPIRLAITHLVSHWFENREPFSSGQMYQVPSTFEMILMPYRFLRLG